MRVNSLASETIAVKTEKLTKMFGNFCAVDHVDLEVQQGEIFGFLGANGAGKTTMIRILCGLLLPTSGEGKVAGLDIYRESEKIKTRIGYMSQKFSLYNDLKISENILFYGTIYGLTKQEIKVRKSTLLELTGLADMRDILVSEMPFGFKQRLALTCATLHDPDIIFLDEPTSGIDPQARRAFWELIYKLSDEGKTIFVTTHFMDEAEYCHRVSIMRNGKVIALDTPHELRKRYGATMQDVFINLVKTTNSGE